MNWTNETLTDDIVGESAMDNMKKLEPQFGRLTALMSRAEVLLQSKEDPGQRLIEVREIRDEVAAIASTVAACRAGCSHCCHMAVGITSSDAAKIGEHLGITPEKPRMQVDPSGNVDKYMNVPCPFLKKKHCTIYEVRPSACRTHYNVSNYPEVCDTVNFPGRDVPSLDMRPIWTAECLLSVRDGQTHADIRDFFPEGANPTQKL